MKRNTSSTHNQDIILKSLSDFSSRVPGLKINCTLYTPQNSGHAHQPDLMLDLTLPPDGENNANNGSVAPIWRLAIESVRHTSPSLLDAALAILTQYVDTDEQARGEMLPVAIVPVLFAPYLSPTVIDRCTGAGVNCVDAAGNGRIVLGTRTYIERVGQPAPTEHQEAIASLFTPKAERVLRVLLNAAGALHHTWRVQPLAEEARVSIGQVARIKAALHERGFITEDSTVRHHGGFHLTQPEALLKEWATSVRTKRNRLGVDHTYHAVDSVMELKRMLCRKISDHRNKVALSGLLAAERYAPYVVSPRFTAYIVEQEDVTLERFEEALDLQPVQSGINVVLTLPRDEGILYLPEDIKAEFIASPDSIQTVSPIQAYLDLQRLGGRAEEGAQHLLEAYLRPRWQGSWQPEGNKDEPGRWATAKGRSGCQARPSARD